MKVEREVCEMNLKILIFSIILIASQNLAADYDDYENYVSVPLNAENYENILNLKPLIFVKFFTTWFVNFFTMWNINSMTQFSQVLLQPTNV